MYTTEQTSLTREQKQVVGLLSIGTFLEYFDLWLYIHMAGVLNGLFFPPSDPLTTSLLSAFAFCSTFVFRPFGALIFGYIGDNIGRRHTVVITTFAMAISCIVIANLPTYAQIGVTASVLLTLCRIVQGMSSMGEIIGAEIFVTESTKPPVQYRAVASIVTVSTLGAFAALAIASLSTSYNFNWRIAFWIGAVIAVIGALARTTLRETPEFTDARRYLNNVIETAKTKVEIDEDKIKRNVFLNIKVNKYTALYYFFMECVGPVFFYFIYMHCGNNILKDAFGYTSAEVIHHNLIVATIDLSTCIAIAYLSYYIYPLKIVRFRLSIFWIFILVSPYLLQNAQNAFHVFLIQSIFLIFRPSGFPSDPIIFKYFPIFKRFTCVSGLFALSRAVMHVVTSFGMVFLANYFGNIGILIIVLPVSIAFLFGLNHFERLEKVSKEYEARMDIDTGAAQYVTAR